MRTFKTSLVTDSLSIKLTVRDGVDEESMMTLSTHLTAQDAVDLAEQLLWHARELKDYVLKGNVLLVGG